MAPLPIAEKANSLIRLIDQISFNLHIAICRDLNLHNDFDMGRIEPHGLREFGNEDFFV